MFYLLGCLVRVGGRAGMIVNSFEARTKEVIVSAQNTAEQSVDSGVIFF